VLLLVSMAYSTQSQPVGQFGFAAGSHDTLAILFGLIREVNYLLMGNHNSTRSRGCKICILNKKFIREKKETLKKGSTYSIEYTIPP
jgi:hypothetical protein